MGTKPIVSVITVVKDHEQGLLDTYQSLHSQLCIDWQNVIVVGKSQDETLRNARALAAKDIRVLIIEEEARGIYPAMNLGIEHSVGEYLWFMNAGDKFFDSSVIGTGLELIEKSNADIVLGGHRVHGDPRKFHFLDSALTVQNFMYNRRSGCHQSMIFRKSAVLRDSCYDVIFKLASDYDLVIRLLNEKPGVKSKKVFSLVEPGGLTDQGLKLMHQEKHRIRMANMGSNPLSRCKSLTWMFLALKKIELNKFVAKGINGKKHPLA
jgi:glycosyltransferase involved in cell wall biosynthesis